MQRFATSDEVALQQVWQLGRDTQCALKEASAHDLISG
jgi:hypothetical protein